MTEIIALCVLLFVYSLIVIRSRLKNIPFWIIMSVGALLVMGLRIISFDDAIKSINLQVIGFIIGMFSITTALEKSGIINKVIGIALSRVKRNTLHIIIVVVFISGILAAFIVNDTAAILLIPFAMSLSNQLKIKPAIILISMAVGINIGSTMTPIGSPQNLLIANQSGLPIPFMTFLFKLGPPTILNLIISSLVLYLYYRKTLNFESYLQVEQTDNKKEHVDKVDEVNNILVGVKLKAYLLENKSAKISTIVFISTIISMVLSELIDMLFKVQIGMGIISLLGALVLYVTNTDRISILRSINYSVIIFFISMFIFTSALWSSGLIPHLLNYFPKLNMVNNDINTHKSTTSNIIYNNAIISVTSISLSQILSNVPFVAIYNPFMIVNGFDGQDVSEWLMLASASTIAGNLTVFGAASNIIIMQTVESRGLQAFRFLEFFKIGFIITLVNISVYYLCLVYF